MRYMDTDQRNEPLPRTDRVLVAIAIALLLFFFALYLNDDLFSYFFRLNRKFSDKPVVGEITFMSKDIRHRDSMDLSWEPAFNRQQIRQGDGVFTGAGSTAKVALNQGSVIEVGENSLVIFSQLNGMDFPDLTRGRLAVKVEGKLKIGIHGEETELDGKNAMVELYIDRDNKARLKLLSGKAKVKNKEVDFNLKTNKIASLIQPDVTKPKPPPPPPKLTTIATNTEYTYFDKVYDVYRHEKGVNWSIRAPREPYVKMSVLMTWTATGEPKKIYGQHATTAEFANPYQFETIGTSFSTREVFLGENYWRVSADNKTWSTQHFTVNNRLIPTEPPQIKVKVDYLLMFRKHVFASYPIESRVAYMAYMAETSTSPDFNPSLTQSRWIEGGHLQADIYSPGVYYFRVRGINHKMELSRYSDTQKITVLQPEAPSMPRLSDNILRGYVDEPVATQWQAPKDSASFLLEVRDPTGKVVHKNQLHRPNFQFKSSKPGAFTYSVTSINKWGQRSKQAATGGITIMKRVAVQPPPPPERKPAQATSVTKADPLLNYRNTQYASSTFDFEGGGMAMYSSLQVGLDVAAERDLSIPLAGMIHLRARRWYGNNGIDGTIGTKAVNLNQEGEATSPSQLEVRYLHQWKIGFNPFFSFDEMRFTTILGVENYMNPGNTNFSPGYNLAKVGFGLAFPAFTSWDTGGEIVYGLSPGADQKYEVSGFIHYFLKRNWSLGAGYRVHLFISGSEASAPEPPAGVDRLPYREGYGEGYSVLRYHY